MNTKLLMTTFAVALSSAGIALIFSPDEASSLCGLDVTPSLRVLVQIVGAMYFAFGMLNWMTKESLIGGIYHRPVVVTNLSHFVIGALGLVKSLMSHPDQPLVVWLAAAFYAVCAAIFGILFLRHPSKREQPS
jgi:Na+-driven multidrug efflux pump